MLAKARCPVCTLQPPCKHYNTADDIVSDAHKIINQPDFKEAINASKREKLLNQLKRETNKLPITFNND
jgi:hypothetical protein